QLGASDETPPTRRRERIHPGLPVRDRDRAGRHALARTLEARGDDLRIEPAAVREAGHEPEEVRVVFALRVKSDELIDAEMRALRRLREIGAVVCGGDLHKP